MSSNVRITKKCIFCGEEYIARTVFTKYCSLKCNRKHYKQKLKQAQTFIALKPEKCWTVSQEILTKFEYLSIAQTCTLLGISRTTLYRLLKNKHLNFMKIGRRVIIKKLDIEKLYEQN